MKTFQSLIPALGLVAAVQAWANDWNGTYVTTTVTTDIYTTYCPVATTIHQGTKTYTATASETLTITDCPCTYVTSHPGKPTTTAVPHSYVSPSSNVTWIPPVYVTTTKTVDIYTTYCPVPTTVTQGTKTYIVTQETTLTISDCPCTEVTSVPAPSNEYTTKTFSTLTTYCPESTTITHGGQTYPVPSGTVTIPIISVSALPPSISQITDGQPQAPTAAPTPEPTIPAGTTYVPSATQSEPLQVTGAAAKNIAGVGAFAAAGLAMIL